ncbi:DExH-box ATP-dependent RNA helicase DExH6 isoform X1 [Tanacetum coccineum]
MGMKSRSTGSKTGNNRRVTVRRQKEKSKKAKEKCDLTSFTFLEEGKEVLTKFFFLYPPGEHGEAEKTKTTSSKNSGNTQRTDDIICKPKMKKAEIEKKLESVTARMESDLKLKHITEDRSKLPIASFKDVVLISGETGCGKTTQVPQYLLDYMWSKGDAFAERISSKRGESIGDTVGCKIRLENKGGRHSSIMFCTNGVLLRVMVKAGNSRSGKEASAKNVKDAFPDITHIIVDEIHERDRFSDMMLAIIRCLLHYFD